MPDEHKNTDTEVVAKATRRFFTAEYKARILKELQTCKADPGSIGQIRAPRNLGSRTVVNVARKTLKTREQQGAESRHAARANPHSCMVMKALYGSST